MRVFGHDYFAICVLGDDSLSILIDGESLAAVWVLCLREDRVGVGVLREIIGVVFGIVRDHWAAIFVGRQNGVFILVCGNDWVALSIGSDFVVFLINFTALANVFLVFGGIDRVSVRIDLRNFIPKLVLG